jgi:hypothetical protein
MLHSPPIILSFLLLGKALESRLIWFSATDLGAASLPLGSSFTAIHNTSVSPISGTFANLADDAIVIIGSNKLQADYQGGDGNDLTLTVVP